MDILADITSFASKVQSIPFLKYSALQKYLPAEQGIQTAHQCGYSHCYIDFSVSSDHIDTWNTKRIKNIIKLIDQLKTFPIMHGNFRIPLASEINEIRQAAVKCTKKESPCNIVSVNSLRA